MPQVFTGSVGHLVPPLTTSHLYLIKTTGRYLSCNESYASSFDVLTSALRFAEPVMFEWACIISRQCSPCGTSCHNRSRNCILQY